MGDKGGGMIRKNDPNSDFWQHAERVSRKVDGFPPWKLGRLEQMEFKVGDAVRVNQPISECHKAEGEILRFGRIDPCLAQVKLADGRVIAFFTYELELTPEPDFKVGDRVRVRPGSDDVDLFSNHTGKVTSVEYDKSARPYGVRFDGSSSTGFFEARELKLLSEPEPKFKFGDLAGDPEGAGWDINVRRSKLSYDRILREAEPHLFAIVRRNDEPKCVLLVTASGRSRITAVRQTSYLTWRPLHDRMQSAIAEARRVKEQVEAFERNQLDPRIQVRVEVV